MDSAQKVADDLYKTLSRLNGLMDKACRAGLTLEMEMLGGDIIHGALGRKVQIPRLMIICNRPLDIVDLATPVVAEGDANIKYSAYAMTPHGTEIKPSDGE